MTKNKKKTTTDLNAKHFSRYGEFLVSFELSKHGWNVYDPVYKDQGREHFSVMTFGKWKKYLNKFNKLE